MARLRWGIAPKLIFFLIGSMVLAFGLLTFLTVLEHGRRMEQYVVESALRVTDTIKLSTHIDMLHRDPGDVRDVVSSDPNLPGEVKRIINSIAEQHGIERIRIFNKQGRILYSSFPVEVGRTVDKNNEACYICHEQDRPLTKLKKEQRWRIFDGGDGRRLLGLISTFENDKRCNSCHGESKAALLGVLDVRMSLADVDGIIAEETVKLLIGYLVTILIISVVSGLFVVVFVHKPVKRLMEGTERVARGELGYRLTIHSQDEIGLLAESFNRMTADLKEARDEITNWAHTLEKRVAEKTEELKRAQERIIHIEKMASLGKLSAIVAHEINNPLMGVLTYAKLMRRKLERKVEERELGKDADFEECGKYLSIIETETSRCGEIVKNLLLFSKKTTLQLKPTDLNELLNKSVMLLRHQMELQSIECQTHLDPDLPPLTCDPGQIQQVIVALLINACEAIGERGTIGVVSRLCASRRALCLRVSDDGCGMDDETQRHLFEPFFTTKESSNGSGLGLAVVYGIIERHGGRISFESKVGEGTTFSIELPLQPPDRAGELRVLSGSKPAKI